MVLQALTAVETELLTALYAMRAGLLTEFFYGITALGSVTVATVIIAGIWIYGRRRTALLSTVSLVFAGGVTLLLKLLVARARPEIARQFPRYAVDPYAFPSGHATVAFVLATVLAESVEDSAVQTYLYGVAVLVAVSRVYLGVHYVTDVVAGAFVGIVGAIIVLQRRERILAPFDRYL